MLKGKVVPGIDLGNVFIYCVVILAVFYTKSTCSLYIFDRQSNEPEIMKNSDHRHQGNSKNKSFSPAPKFK